MSKNKTLTLNRSQIEKLWQMVNHFEDVNHFRVSTDNSSGIGTGVVVSFDLFEKNDTKVDITDVSEW